MRRRIPVYNPTKICFFFNGILVGYDTRNGKITDLGKKWGRWWGGDLAILPEHVPLVAETDDHRVDEHHLHGIA